MCLHVFGVLYGLGLLMKVKVQAHATRHNG
ncbi:hypothetical protein RSAG8_09118, partial [Rhizoctonia solani AG-8 WAC10335]